jgi:hypothetical protein
MPGGRQGAHVMDVVERFGLVACLYEVISVMPGAGPGAASLT